MTSKHNLGCFLLHVACIAVAHIQCGVLQSPLWDMAVGKIRGEWKKFGVGGKNIFQMFCVLSQNFCVPSRIFAFPHKDICVLSQNLPSLAKIFFKEVLRGNAKVLRGNANIFARERKVSRGERKSFARERKYLCEGTQRFSRERKSFARERKTFEKYFFLSPRIFPTAMSLKGLSRV